MVVVAFFVKPSIRQKNPILTKNKTLVLLNRCSPRTAHPARGGAPDSLTDCSRFAFCSPACGPFIKHVSAFQRRLGPLVAFQTPARRPRAPDKRLDHLEGRRPSFVSTGKHEWVAGGGINSVALITVAGSSM